MVSDTRYKGPGFSWTENSSTVQNAELEFLVLNPLVAAVGTVPLAAELSPMGCQEVGLAPGPTSLCPRTPWAFCGALGGLESVELAEVASGAWLEQTKTPGSAVAL